MKKLVQLFCAAVLCVATTQVHAGSVSRLVEMSFESGAEFSGVVVFKDDFSIVEAVSGTLTGYEFSGMPGTGSTSINWVWANGFDFSPGVDQYSTFLMDGPGSGYVNSGDYSNWIQFAYDYSNISNLLFTINASINGTDNHVNYLDRMISGSISSFSAVPEPASMSILGIGALGMAAFARRKLKRSA